MQTLDVGFDIDGILYPFEYDLAEYMILHRGYPRAQLTIPWMSWSHWQEWGIGLEEFMDICHEATDKRFMFLNADPYEGAAEAVRAVHDMGHRVHMITSRKFGSLSAANTEEWLTRHDIPYDSLIMTHEKSMVRPDLMVDDYQENVWRMRDAGTEIYLLDQSWNRHVEVEGRIRNLEEYVTIVAERAVRYE